MKLGRRIWRWLTDWLWDGLPVSSTDSTVDLEPVDAPPPLIVDNPPLTIGEGTAMFLHRAARSALQVNVYGKLQDKRVGGEDASIDDEVKLYDGRVGVVVGIDGKRLRILCGKVVVGISRSEVEYAESMR